jgi:hypothetical protein
MFFETIGVGEQLNKICGVSSVAFGLSESKLVFFSAVGHWKRGIWSSWGLCGQLEKLHP